MDAVEQQIIRTSKLALFKLNRHFGRIYFQHDFQHPKVIKPPSPIDPRVKQNRNVIMRRDIGDVKFEKTSTYKHDFQRWENVRPRETYQIIEVYQPPKEKMMFETNQRSHFKGIANVRDACIFKRKSSR